MDLCHIREIDHTADLALHIEAQNFVALLGCSSRALHIALDLRLHSSDLKSEKLTLEEPDQETLLIRWLEEQLFLIDTENRAWQDWQISLISPLKLSAEIRTAPINALQRQIKAVTYSELDIRQSRFGLETVVVFDV